MIRLTSRSRRHEHESNASKLDVYDWSKFRVNGLDLGTSGNNCEWNYSSSCTSSYGANGSSSYDWRISRFWRNAWNGNGGSFPRNVPWNERTSNDWRKSVFPRSSWHSTNGQPISKLSIKPPYEIRRREQKTWRLAQKHQCWWWKLWCNRKMSW